MSENDTAGITRRDLIAGTAGAVVGAGLAGCSSAKNAKRAKSTPTEITARHRKLGKTGLSVSAVGFGATRTDEPSVMKRVIDLGVNYLDTGRMYSNGRNEETIGKVIRSVRHDVIIQSKFHQRLWENPSEIEKSIDESLRALGRDYIDVLLFRWPVEIGQMTARSVRDAFESAKEKGKIRFSGFSSHANQAEMLKEARESGIYDVALLAYNHAGNYTHPRSGRFYEWDQDALELQIEKAAAAGMGIVAMKTCAGGPRKEAGEDAPTYTSALKWILDNPHIGTVVPGMANYRQVDEDVAAMTG